ncbi:g1085 [Coccomyxa viridis]|uniref:G1085 protein n=1 Tax=Coccomyxa viridis TaxID=1274662 RepID=A0ABP1FP20_9CHLO
MLKVHFVKLGAFLLLLLARQESEARPLDDTEEALRSDSRKRAYAIVQPIADKTSLHLESEGLAVLRDIQTPVAPVVVIGPYRSGKSFLLNQLLGVGCDEGFGVGHTRNTQTKGVWLWGQPDVVPAGSDGVTTAIIYVDTEGFESTGKSDAYDDRIFALSAIISSLLVYNLPETVRESDVEKLSFAVQLAEGFYAASQGGAQQVRAPVEAPNMLWLIQRDFLEGKTVQQMVSEALSEVPNPTRNVDIAQVNRIRESLGRVVRNSTAAGLRQPHLERTRLCELSDAELDPVYVRQRDALRDTVRQLAHPKSVNGQVMTGPVLAELIETMVGALNARDIPTAGSILEHFNRELVQKVKEEYIEALEALTLPVEEDRLEATHERALSAALATFDENSFGVTGSPDLNILRDTLKLGCSREHEARRTSNMLKSTQACEAAEVECESVLEREQSGTLPSTGRFQARFERCRARFEDVCIGPARAGQEERLGRAEKRERSRFVRDYNDRLFNGLVIASLAVILLFRFVIRISLLETLGWVAFAFLQVYPKMFLRGGTMYDTTWWAWLVTVWEVVVYNSVLDLQQCWQVVLPVAVLAFAGLKWYHRSRRRRRQREEKQIVRQGSRSQDIRDLNV